MRSTRFWLGYLSEGQIKKRVWKVYLDSYTCHPSFSITAPLYFRAELQSILDDTCEEGNLANILNFSAQQTACGLDFVMLREGRITRHIKHAEYYIELGPDHPNYTRPEPDFS